MPKKTKSEPFKFQKPYPLALYSPPEVRGIDKTVFRVGVRVLGDRRAYGRDECLVEPQVGTGKAWVRAASLLMLDRAE